MGSALTVLLSVSRSINLSLAIMILFELITPSLISPALVAVILFFLLFAFTGALPLTNYYEYQLAPAIEILLVYVLLGLLYFITKTDQMFFVIVAVVYSLCVIASLFPSGEFDKMAATNFWSDPFRLSRS